ncbi:hypothetical protein MSC49_06850 [Methylosinus sp. C49]|uniref:DUF4260 domain-containing protein n=1 Tax=Methylosinus sp. C49 TaxID=2699395 RepID=UPI001366E5D2|nr:DUF4260 domain-containing protein [Methylosinus sp. C49]BBU60750.1 hypothetical protein MSC49_06850 [Methylosinus sp. C49]
MLPGPASGSVLGWPKILLRLEGAALMAAALFAYFGLGADWRLLAWLFLFPDLSMAFYLAGPRIGAIAYNIAHTTIIPFAVLGAGVYLGQGLMISIALIHFAHIGFDRMLGFGLKYGSAFGDTHLGRVGRPPDAAA